MPYQVGALYAALASAQPGSIRLFRTQADFLDIGTPADYLNTALILADRDGLPCAGSNSRVDFSARVERSVLWDDVEVGEGAFLHECVVTDDVTIPSDTSWRGVTIRPAGGDLFDGERVVGGLAVRSL